MFKVNQPNLLTFDKTTGGLAAFVGWSDLDGTPHPGNVDLTLTLDEDTGVTTVPFPTGFAVSPLTTVPGLRYTAAATCDHLTVITIRWVTDDGVVTDPVIGFGNLEHRAVVSGVAPPNTHAAIVGLFAPVARVDADDTLTLDVSYWDLAAAGLWSFYADEQPEGPVTVSHVVFVQGNGDPGPLDPIFVDNTFGQRVWESLPDIYREADLADTRTGKPLSKFLHGMFAGIDAVEAMRDDIAAGSLTDPTLIADGNVAWLAQLVGIPAGRTVPETRVLLQTYQTAPAAGSRRALAALGRTFLTGSKVCDVFPHPTNQWAIVIRVRADQLSLVTDAAGFAAAMYATGQIPAGYTLYIQTAMPTWGDLQDAADTDSGHWSGIDTGRDYWADVDSIGVAGLS